MMRITIVRPADRKKSGSLTVTGSGNEVVLGPLPVAVGILATGADKSAEITAFSPFNSTVALPARYTIKQLLPMSGASVEEVREFGRYGFIVLEPATSGSRQEPLEPAETLSIHGGELSPAGHLRGHHGSLRLSNQDQRELMRILAVRDLEEVECFCIESADDGLADIAEPFAAGPPAPLARFAKLATLMAVAAPFAAQGTAYAVCNPYDSGSAFSAVDFDFILDSEGRDQLIGYVPSSSAGVTIAGGLDLGFQTSQQMLAMGFSQAQVTAFAPYLATSTSQPLIGQPARNVLAQTPLTIVQSHASLIDHVVYSYNSNLVAGLYNTAVKAAGALPGVTFSSLPVAWQTAIADMYFAYPPFSTTPCFRQMASGQWTAAIASLRNFGTTMKTINDRAKADGDYLSNKLTGLPS